MVRDLLVVCALLGAIVASVVVANAWGGGGGQEPGVEGQKASGEQIFATDPFNLEPGLTVVEMSHRGKGSFVVNLLSAGQEEAATSEPVEFSGDKTGGSSTEMAIALADEKGPVVISKAVKVPTSGKHMLDVTADGPWTVRVEQPDPSDAAETTSFGGSDDVATPLFQLSSGPKRITVNNPNGGALNISLLDEDGNVIAPVRGTESGRPGQYPNGATSIIDIPESGAYLFNVRANSLWAIEIADAG